MKTAGVKMGLESDTAQIFDKDIALNLTTSVHYCIPIDRAEKIPGQQVFSVDLEEMACKDRYKTLFKLHRQFAHPPTKKLKSLLQDADQWKDEYSNLLEDIGNMCELYKRYAKTPSRPVVGLPMASQFNEKVSTDLKQWNGHWLLHIIDIWSRYTLSDFINRKKPSDVIDALMQRWIAVFGTMGSIMTDNGGEFSSDEMREVASILNMRLITTAADSPFQKRLCERVHSVTDMMLLKLTEENKKTESETLLSWANMARKFLQMWNGFSSHQLVFGKNPNLPGIMSDKLPALEGTTSSEIFTQHLNALNEARRAYIQTEANERIRRVLRTKVRTAEQIYQNGNTVFYKREGKERWLGPASVVFQDGKVVSVRHEGIFVRVSPNRLSKVQDMKSKNKIEHNDTESYSKHSDGVAGKIVRKVETRVSETGTYEEVVNSGQKTLSARWFITTKDRNIKARLVVRGVEEEDLEIPRDSPTVGKGEMRVFLSVAAL